MAKVKNFENASFQWNLYFLVDFEDNCVELSWITSFKFANSTGYFYTIPPFDTSSKSLRHNLEFLTIWGHKDSSNTITQTKLRLQRQIQLTQYLDLLFPYLKCIEMGLEDEFWLGIRDLLCKTQAAWIFDKKSVNAKNQPKSVML